MTVSMASTTVDWLNYHHFYYFWTVAREGSIARASKVMRVAPPTISGQIKLLERSLGEHLFDRVGRGLVLTDAGRMVLRYADEIFGLGKEMLDTLRGRPTGRPARLVVGVVDALAKLVSHQLLAPARALPDPPRLVVREGPHERLLAELSVSGLDLVLSDAPVGPGARLKAFNRQLGECGVSVMGVPSLVAKHARAFPASLDGAPMVLPGESAGMRRALDAWFAAQGIAPKVVAEIDDSALAKVFGAAGEGLFVVPSLIERQVGKQHGVSTVGRIDAVRERFYAISVERRVKHPAVAAICEAARTRLFA
jgi:LysR family transcriptional activator of nhaA